MQSSRSGRDGRRDKWNITTVPLVRGRARLAAREPAVRASSVDYGAMRSPASSREEKLTSVTHAWIKTLAQQIRPYELCFQFPRIVNRIALCWPDHVLLQRILEDLLVDRRGGRRGFPAEVKAELMALREESEQLRLGVLRELAGRRTSADLPSSTAG